MPRPAAPLLAAIDRAFDTCGDRYSCAATLREAIVAARVAAFEGLSRPGGGIRTAAVHAGVVDHLVRRAYAFVARYAGADRDPSRLGASVVAIGDYGRQELPPHASIEVVVVHPATDPAEHARVAVEALFPFLKDAGVPIVHRLASTDELRGAMVADPKAAAALLDARHVTGDPEAWGAFRREVAAPFLAAEGRRLLERWIADLRARHADRDGPALGKEPDLLRSPGGLLDLRALAALDQAARAALPGVLLAAHPWGAAEVEERLGELLRARDSLLAARAALHLEAEGPEDHLELDRWVGVAERLPGDASGPSTLLPAEVVLQRLRRHGRVVLRAVERLVGVVERAARRDRPVERVALSEAFDREGDRLVPRADDVFYRVPSRLVAAFRLLGERDLRPSERLIHLARRDAPLLAPGLRDDRGAWDQLRQIFEANGRTSSMLRALASAGVLAAMVPEFEAVSGLSRLEERHAHPVDEHLLRAVAVADALEEEDEELPEEVRALARRIPDLAVLKLALFVHDLGKAEGADHAVTGERLARPLVARLGLDPARAEDVAFLVREHQSMSRQGRPLDVRDEASLEAFGRRVETVARLRLLYLLTVCDLRATSPTAFTRWPAELLRDLLQRTTRFLEEREASPKRSGAREDHLARMPEAYAKQVDAEEIELHLELAGRVAGGDVAALAWDDGAPRRRLWIVAKDRPRLFADLCGALALSGFDVAEADAFARADGVTFDRFVLEARGGRDRPTFDLAALRASVTGVLRGEIEPASEFRRAAEASGPPSPAAEAAGAEVLVRLQATADDDRFEVTVAAPDRPGLLHDVARAVAAANLEIVRATAETRGDRLEMTFEARGGPQVFSDARLDELRRSLVVAARAGAWDDQTSSKRKSSS